MDPMKEAFFKGDADRQKTEFQVKICPVVTAMSLWFLFLFLWLQLPSAEGKQETVCAVTDPFQFPFEYNQKGDQIIGEITSQLGFVFDELYFSEHPKTKSVYELL